MNLKKFFVFSSFLLFPLVGLSFPFDKSITNMTDVPWRIQPVQGDAANVEFSGCDTPPPSTTINAMDSCYIAPSSSVNIKYLTPLNNKDEAYIAFQAIEGNNKSAYVIINYGQKGDLWIHSSDPHDVNDTHGNIQIKAYN